LFHPGVAWFSRIFGVRPSVVVWSTPEKVVTPEPGTLPAVVRAIQLISTDIARLPVRVCRADGTTVEDHPLVSILTREASRWQSGFDFRRYVTGCALSSGNGLAVIRRAADGTVAELQPIPEGAARARFMEDGTEYQVADVRLSGDQVLHIGAYPDLAFPAWFMSPVDACLPALKLAADQDGAHGALVRTGSMGKVVISHPGAMSDQTVQAIRDAWMNMHATADGASRPLILREGMKADRISQESSSSILESRRYSVQEIARAFGIPPEMLFQQGGGALASQAETARAYVDSGISQWVTAWESELTRKLCDPGEYVKFDTNVLLRGNLKDAGQSLSKLVLAGIMSPNDARHLLGLDPMEGLDEAMVSMPGGASAATGPNETSETEVEDA
jgi:HK97 family phage portal protein